MSSKTKFKLVEIPAKTGRKLTCLCGYSWVYSGTRAHASCPHCRSSVTIEPKQEQKGGKVSVSRQKPSKTATTVETKPPMVQGSEPGHEE